MKIREKENRAMQEKIKQKKVMQEKKSKRR